jgi:Rod binding domain-containing protein
MDIANAAATYPNRQIDPFAPQSGSRFTMPGSRLDAAAKEFEAVFISQMLAPLFSSVSTPEIAGGGKGEEFFKALLQDSYARAMAERGGFGLADHVKSSLIDLQGGAADAPARSQP